MATKFPPPDPPFIGARHHGGAQKPKAIVLHGTVSSDNKGTARNIAEWWHGPKSPVTSAHYIVDPGEVIQAVLDHLIAFHCGFNTGSIAVELCDEQTGPATRWADADSVAILKRAARLVAELCLAYDIEAKRPTVAELKRKGPHGIYGHNDSRLAFGNTTHTDPREFPWAKFLDMVRAEIRAIRAERKPKPRRKTFKLLHAPLHGNSATPAELLRARKRKGVQGIEHSEAYKHGKTLSKARLWRLTTGSGRLRNARNTLYQRDIALLVRRRRRHVDSGMFLACKESTPARIAPERWGAWTIDWVHGRPVAMIGLHPHAAVFKHWDSDRAAEFRRGMRRLEAQIRLLRIKYGADLDIVFLGDLNYPNVDDGRHWAPRQVFERLGMKTIVRGIDWVAYSAGLRVVSTEVIPSSENGQDHPWVEVEFARR